MLNRRSQVTLLEIPSDHGVGRSRTTPTMLGHASMVEPAPEPVRAPLSRPAPWTETVYVSPSGRIFLPPGFDFGDDGPRGLSPHTVRRAAPTPAPRRAHVVIGQVGGQVPRPRTTTRESWVVPPHLQRE